MDEMWRLLDDAIEEGGKLHGLLDVIASVDPFSVDVENLKWYAMVANDLLDVIVKKINDAMEVLKNEKKDH